MPAADRMPATTITMAAAPTSSDNVRDGFITGPCELGAVSERVEDPDEVLVQMVPADDGL